VSKKRNPRRGELGQKALQRGIQRQVFAVDGASYAAGVQQAGEITKAFYDAAIPIERLLAIMAALSNSDNGPKTRATLQKALGEFTGAVDNFDTVRRQMEHEYAGTLQGFDGVTAAWRDMREAAKQFLVIGTDKEQRAFYEVVARIMPDAEQWRAIVDNAGRRGRPQGIGGVQAYILQEVRALWYDPTAKRSLAGSANRLLNTLRAEYQKQGKRGMQPSIRYEAYVKLSKVQDVAAYVENLDKEWPDNAINA
jgi:hypothetical protein